MTNCILIINHEFIFIWSFVFFLSEILRAIDSLQIAYKHNVYTPANWHFGERCMIPETVRDDEFDLLYPMGFDVLNMPSGRSYMRLIDCPRHV